MGNNGDGVSDNGVQGGGAPAVGNVPATEPVVSPEVAAEPVAETPVVPADNGNAASASTPVTPVSTPGAAPASQKKSNGTLIAIIIAVAVVLITVITVLVVVLVNNSSSKSQSNRGGSHYEEDEKDDDDDSGSYGHYEDDDNDDSYTSSVGSISCLGYRFEKQSGYRYTCEGDALEISGTVFAMYIELLEGMSYYQAEGHADELAAQLSQGLTVNSHRKYTASNGRKMLVFDVDNDGTGMYVFITAASTSSVLVVQTANENGRPVTADLETAADLLSDSTVASRLPEGDVEDEGEVPTVDWTQYLKAPELQK